MYGDKRPFALLSLVYPFIDLRNEFHIDHVFPQTKFKRPALRQAGIDPDDIDGIQDHAQRLGNLQLPQGSFNQAKNNLFPKACLDNIFKDNKAGRDDYVQRHDIPPVPDDIKGFESFYKERRDRITARLRELLTEPTPKAAATAQPTP